MSTNPPAAQPSPPPDTSPEHLALIVDIWKYAVGVQMHFNDMGMKIRNLYFTILAAAIGLIGVVQGRSTVIPFPHISIHLVLFVIASVIPISMLFYFLDKHWYHRLLIGAVKHCATIETRYASALPEIQLGTAISAESPVRFGGWWRHFLWYIRDRRFRDKKTSNIHSDAKIEVLYKSVMVGAATLALAYALFDGAELGGCTPVAWSFGHCQPNWKSGTVHSWHRGPK